MRTKRTILSAIAASAVAATTALIPVPAHAVVGGEDVGVYEHPFLVSVQGRNGEHLCGGTLLNSVNVVTAAQCVDGASPDDLRVSVGDHDLNSNSETPYRVVVDIASITAHPRYDSETVDNDIALIELADPVEFNRAVRPAPLATSVASDEDAALRLNAPVYAIGWGTTSQGGEASDIPLVGRMGALNTEDCRASSNYGADLTGNMFCASAPGVGTCQGDAGGPVGSFLNPDGSRRATPRLIGVVSWGYGCAQPNYPDVNTKLDNYVVWIADNLKRDHRLWEV
ncbi:serine protease [Nocardiopsis sp. NPDC049922]|uniref:serine protease n=1 Tax=Nocardiopsis sp. NPDC049922 TaxID=3155157 RepID=UPI0033E1D9A7